MYADKEMDIGANSDRQIDASVDESEGLSDEAKNKVRKLASQIEAVSGMDALKAIEQSSIEMDEGDEDMMLKKKLAERDLRKAMED